MGKVFVIQKAEKKPQRCKLYHELECLHDVAHDDFSVNNLLNIIVNHACRLFDSITVYKAEKQHLTVEVRDWSIESDILFLPVFVTGTEVHKWVYRFEADKDVYDYVIATLEENSNTSEETVVQVQYPTSREEVKNKLYFTDLTKIPHCLNVNKNNFAWQQVRVWYLVGDGTYRLYESYQYFFKPKIVLGEALYNRVLQQLCCQWPEINEVTLSTIIEVTFMDHVIVDGNPVICISTPEGTVSMEWKIHCYYKGVYLLTYTYMIEIHNKI